MPEPHNLHEFIKQEVYKDERIGFIKKVFWKYFWPSTNAVFLIRKMQFSSCKIYKRIIQIILIRRYGINIGMFSKIGLGLKFPHPYGITIGEYVEIGGNAIIFQNTTFGAKLLPYQYSELTNEMYPKIGNDVCICANAIIIGNVHVGNNTIVGAGAVLLTDTEEGATYSGVPAKMTRNKS